MRSLFRWWWFWLRDGYSIKGCCRIWSWSIDTAGWEKCIPSARRYWCFVRQWCCLLVFAYLIFIFQPAMLCARSIYFSFHVPRPCCNLWEDLFPFRTLRFWFIWSCSWIEKSYLIIIFLIKDIEERDEKSANMDRLVYVIEDSLNLLMFAWMFIMNNMHRLYFLIVLVLNFILCCMKIST